MGINYCLIAIYKKGDLLKMKVIHDMDFFSNLYAAMFEHSVITN